MVNTAFSENNEPDASINSLSLVWYQKTVLPTPQPTSSTLARSVVCRFVSATINIFLEVHSFCPQQSKQQLLAVTLGHDLSIRNLIPISAHVTLDLTQSQLLTLLANTARPCELGIPSMRAHNRERFFAGRVLIALNPLTVFRKPNLTSASCVPNTNYRTLKLISKSI